MAPHIDFARGGPVYGWAYKELRESRRSTTFVILGTAHVPMKNLYALMDKDFATPFGPARTDRDFVRSLAEGMEGDPFEDELVHRSEHSVEFQAVFLRHVYPDAADLRIVPILCGSFEEAIHSGRSPMEIGEIASFVESLRKTISATGADVCIVASADLAHVGTQFGDPSPLDASDLERIAREDTEMLKTVEAADPDAFFRSLHMDGDRRRICGFSSIYTLLHAIGPAQGALLKYGQWPDPNGTVTFAALCFR